MKYLIVVLMGFLSSSLLYADELRIFPLHQAKTPQSSFVDISDQQIWPEGLTLKIKPSKRFRLKKNKGNDWDYHRLSYKKSGEILRVLNIKLEDKIYIYNLELNKVTSFKVKNKLPLLVHQNPYGSGEDGVDYYFGFEISNNDYPIKSDDYRDKYLVYIGKKNPYITKNMKKIAWKKTSNDLFPAERFMQEHDLNNLDVKNEEQKDSNGDNYYVEKFYKKDSYSFPKGNLNYYLYFFTRNKKTLYNDFSKTHSKEYSYFIQVKQKDKKIIYERFVKEHEGFVTRSFKEEATSQWVGNLFKNKPPILFNSHESYAFGCNAVYVMDNSHEPIRILCNNRH